MLYIVFVCLFVCLFVWSFSSHSKIFHSFGDVAIVGEALQILTPAGHLLSFEQWRFFSVSYLWWHGPSVCNGHLRGPVTLTPNAESLTLHVLTTGLSWQGFDHPTLRIRVERTNRLRHCRCFILMTTVKYNW